MHHLTCGINVLIFFLLVVLLTFVQVVSSIVFILMRGTVAVLQLGLFSLEVEVVVWYGMVWYC